MAYDKQMEELLSKLHRTDIVDDEEDFFFLTIDIVAAIREESKHSCYDKLMVERQMQMQGLRRFCREWPRLDFKISKIGPRLYQLYLPEVDTMQNIVKGGSWNIEDHLLILKPWQDQVLNLDEEFHPVKFWI